MTNAPLLPGVVAENSDPLARDSEAYWAEQGSDNWVRIVRARGEVVEDQEVAWSQARIADYVRARRTLLQKVLRKELDNTLFHPSGVEVQKVGETRNGLLVNSLITDADMQKEVRKRMTSRTGEITALSASKLFIGNSMLTKLHHTFDDAARVESDEMAMWSVEDAERVYKGALEKLKFFIHRHSHFIEASDLALMHELDDFRRDRVRWATLEHNNALTSQELGRMGDAWIFIIPSNHQKSNSQKAIFSANTDNAGINSVLSILPAKFSHKWACLGLIHELVHLRDSVLGIEPTKNRTRDQYIEGEHRAYSVERAMAFALSEGRLQPALESIVHNALLTHGPYEFIPKLTHDQLVGISQSLDQCIEPESPQSGGELGIRQGLHQMLLCFEIARQIAQEDQVRKKEIEKKFIEQIYSSTGHLPEK